MLQGVPMPDVLMQSAVWSRSTEAEEILKFRWDAKPQTGDSRLQPEGPNLREVFKT